MAGDMARRIVILTEGHTNPHTAKTASCMLRYKTDEIVALLDGTQRGKTTQELLGVGGAIPVVAALSEAPTADTLLLGIAPPGGKIPTTWRPIIAEALTKGMTIWSGLHDFVSNDPEFAQLAAKHSAQIIDVRKNSEREVARRIGIRSDCLRIHTVGHDCSIGKMVASVELTQGLQRRGVDAKFIATGQTGIMVEGDGLPLDCVVADFVSGAAEKMVLQHQHHEVLVVEGQGSLIHPSYSGVTLSLLHGCCPQGLIFVYEIGRTVVTGVDHVVIPPLAPLIKMYDMMANANARCQIIGIAVNSRRVSAAEAATERARVRSEFGLPVCDVIRDGSDELVQAILDFREFAPWREWHVSPQ